MEFPRLFPSPRVSPVGVVRCNCLCHNAPDAPAPVINGIATPGVDRRDALGAASACSRCQHGHRLALSGRPPELDLPLSGRRWNPPSLEAAVPQADGGDGAE